MKRTILCLLAVTVGLASTGCSAPAARRDWRTVGHDLVLPGPDPVDDPCPIGAFATCAWRCDQGNAACCNSAGIALQKGMNVEADPEAALAFYGRACDLQDQAGCANKASLGGATRSP
jgi:hypothetical protein